MIVAEYHYSSKSFDKFESMESCFEVVVCWFVFLLIVLQLGVVSYMFSSF